MSPILTRSPRQFWDWSSEEPKSKKKVTSAPHTTVHYRCFLDRGSLPPHQPEFQHRRYGERSLLQTSRRAAPSASVSASCPFLACLDGASFAAISNPFVFEHDNPDLVAPSEPYSALTFHDRTIIVENTWPESHACLDQRAYPQDLHAIAQGRPDASLTTAANNISYIPTYFISIPPCRLGSTNLTAVIYLLPSCHRATTANCLP